MAHRPIKEGMLLDDSTLQTHFQSIKNLVLCLEELQHLTEEERKNSIDKLDRVNAIIFIMIG